MTKDEFAIFKNESEIFDKLELESEVLISSETSEKMAKTIASIEKTIPLILIIDDDPAVRDSLDYILEQNYKLIFCTSGEEGIQTVNGKVSVVVLDIKMEGKDGFQTFVEIKKKFSHLPIIFHSAYQDLKNPYDVMNEYRPFGYISKNGAPKELLDTVTSAVEYHRQIRKNEILVYKLQILNATLEDKVTERTQELRTSLDQVEQQKVELNRALFQLEEQNLELKETQKQLVQSGKMASLGTIVAGVAHELNNPSNFVYNGAHNIERRLKELKKFIFQLAEDQEEVQKVFEPKLDPLFQNLSAIIEGTKRITNIVTNLRTFSRSDEAKQKEVEVEKNVKSTLELLQSTYQNWVEFICSFDPVPPLKCWPVQLNQVFMNIIVNSCQAIKTQQKAKGKKTRGTLTIRIFTQEENLLIRFEDTGHGMSEKELNQMFDPFFTTKDVGEGTGLGLSITYKIIERHQGRIEVESGQNQGTTITLFLPLAGITGN